MEKIIATINSSLSNNELKKKMQTEQNKTLKRNLLR